MRTCSPIIECDNCYLNKYLIFISLTCYIGGDSLDADLILWLITSSSRGSAKYEIHFDKMIARYKNRYGVLRFIKTLRYNLSRIEKGN